jgi:hypothetical protein
MLNRLLTEEQLAGTLKNEVDTEGVVDMIFSGLLGSCVVYTADKSEIQLDRNIKTMINYLRAIRK